MNLEQADQILSFFDVEKPHYKSFSKNSEPISKSMAFFQSALSSDSSSTPISSKELSFSSNAPSSASSSASSVLRKFTDEPLQTVSVLTEKLSSTSSMSKSSDSTTQARKKVSFTDDTENLQRHTLVRLRKEMLKELQPEDIEQRIALAKVKNENFVAITQDSNGNNEVYSEITPPVVQESLKNFDEMPVLSNSSALLPAIPENVNSCSSDTPLSSTTDELKSGTSTVEIVDVTEQVIEIISDTNKPSSESTTSSDFSSISSLPPAVVVEKKDPVPETKVVPSAEKIVTAEIHPKEANNIGISKEYERGECDKKYDDMETMVKGLTERLRSLEGTIDLLSNKQSSDEFVAKPTILQSQNSDEVARLNEKRLLVLESLQLEQTHLQRRLISLLEGFEENKEANQAIVPLSKPQAPLRIQATEPEVTPAPRSCVKCVPCENIRSEAVPCDELNISNNMPGNLLKQLIEAENSISRDYGTPKSKASKTGIMPDVSPLNLLEKAKFAHDPSFEAFPVIQPVTCSIDVAAHEAATNTYQIFNDVNRLELERCRIESNIDRLRFEYIVNEDKNEPFAPRVFDDRVAEARYRVKKVVGDIIDHHSTSQVAIDGANQLQPPKMKQPPRNLQRPAGVVARETKPCQRLLATNPAPWRHSGKVDSNAKKNVENVPLWRNRDYLMKIYGRDIIGGQSAAPKRPLVRGVRAAKERSPAKLQPCFSKPLAMLGLTGDECDVSVSSSEQTSFDVTCSSTSENFVDVDGSSMKQTLVGDDNLVIIKPAQVFPNRSVPRVTFRTPILTTVQTKQTVVTSEFVNKTSLVDHSANVSADGHNFVRQTTPPPSRTTQQPVHQSTPSLEAAHRTQQKQTKTTDDNANSRMTKLLEEELVQVILRQNRQSSTKMGEVSEGKVTETLTEMITDIIDRRRQSAPKPTAIEEPTPESVHYSSNTYESDTEEPSGHILTSDSAPVIEKLTTPRPSQLPVRQTVVVPDKISVAVATTPREGGDGKISTEEIAISTEPVNVTESRQQTDQVSVRSFGIVTSPVEEVSPTGRPKLAKMKSLSISEKITPRQASSVSVSEKVKKKTSSSTKKKQLSSSTASSSSSSSSSSSAISLTLSSQQKRNFMSMSTLSSESSDCLTECSSISTGQQLVDVSDGEIRLLPLATKKESTGGLIENLFSDDEGDIDFLEKVIAEKQNVGDSEDISFGENKIVESTSEEMPKDEADAKLDDTIFELERMADEPETTAPEKNEAQLDEKVESYDYEEDFED